MKLREIDYILHLHSIGNSISRRIDFKSDKSTTEFFEELRLQGYFLYQYITSDFTYNMDTKELDDLNIEYVTYEFQKRTWFGFGRKTVYDLLILPKDKFYYPYQFGNYFYLLTKDKISADSFINWLNNQFPNKFSDFNDYIGGDTTDSKELLNKSDIIIITLHDYQEELAITAHKVIVDELYHKIQSMELEKFDTIIYDRIKKENVV